MFNRKRHFLFLYAVLWLFMIFAVEKPASAAAIIAQGNCGKPEIGVQYEDEDDYDDDETYVVDTMKWQLDSEGVMTISGTGDMCGAEGYWGQPWGGYRSKVKKLVIEEGVTTIGTCMFQRCTNLSSISWAESLEMLDPYAFKGCTGLQKLELPDNVWYVGNEAFSYCKGLRELKLPASVVNWGRYVFSNCTGINHIELEKGIHFALPGETYSVNGRKWLGGMACSGYAMFYGCGDIEEVVFPKGTDVIPNGFLAGCEIGKLVNFPWKGAYIGCYPSLKGKKKFLVPDYVEVLEGSCFWGSAYEKIILPEGLKKISSGCFENANIKNIKIPDTVEVIEEYVFWDCTGLKGVVFPKGMTEIGTGMFYGCTALENMKLPKGITEIGSRAFEKCKNLKKIHFSKEVTVIGCNAFMGCDSLKKITLPDKVEKVESWLFKNCINLEEVILPKNMKVMGTNAFSGCMNLRTIKITSKNLREVGYEPFYGLKFKNRTTIYVPKGKLKEYKKLFRKSGTKVDKIKWKTL